MPERKSLYDEDYRYTSDAIRLDALTNNALASIFRDYIEMGYSPREIECIMFYVMRDITLEFLLVRTEVQEGQTK